VIPLDGIERDVLAYVPRELTITITSSPTRGLDSTLGLAEQLAGSGYHVVPHLAARLITGRAQLAELLARLQDLGLRDVFVVAGDIPDPAGPFDGAAALLSAIAELGNNLQQIGITGYPESHAFISDEATIQAMFDKLPYATYIVSQICFDADVIGRWIRRVRDRGIGLPIYVGLPGPIEPLRLVRLSAKMGLGESSRFLGRHRSWIGRLTLPRAYRPELLLQQLAPHLDRPENGIAGLHLFTFNEIARLVTWRDRTIARLGTRDPPY
jgi:methylenetetrahydrofolate reductase (NADPH)